MALDSLEIPSQVEMPALPPRYAWRVPYIGGGALCIGLLYATLQDQCTADPRGDAVLAEGLAGILSDVAKMPRKHQPALCDYLLRCFKRGVENGHVLNSGEQHRRS